MSNIYSNYSPNKLEKIIYDPIEEEKQILEFWSKQKTFEKVQEKRKKENNGVFTILNGPPFPTGSPHSGHILNALLKDIYTRYAYQKNLQVKNKFGWDCHGIAIEHAVDRKLNFKEPEDIYTIGFWKYNEECRKFIENAESDWKENFDRIGIMTDLAGAYSTGSLEYMEGVWGIFKKLFDKGLVYNDKQVLPYSTGCFSHLSHFEADQNWKKVNRVSVIVALEIEASDVSLLVLTCSPWKLGANFAVCVNPSATYVKIEMKNENQRKYILSMKRLASVFPNSNEFSILEEFEGKHIVGLKYERLFDYLPGNFTVLQDDSVFEQQGTGILALCPHFNQNEYRICLGNKLLPDEVPCPIDRCGRFTRSINELAGLTTEEATLAVIQSLQQRQQLVQLKNVTRKKRHCWRSDVPLTGRVASSWFVKVGKLKMKLKENNSQVTWVPECNKKLIENQFDKLKDWPVGRFKLWGTPIPLWVSPTGDEIRCIGSVQELLELTSAKKVTDLHKEFIDKLTIPSNVPSNPPLRRVPEVFDCWFESGAMPFIRASKPSPNPADLVLEGQDQLSGWFLTTSILAAALALPAPFKVVASHGLVLGPDGTKLSKRKYNSNDAIKILEKHGADAMRLYLASTPAAGGQTMALDESEVRKFKEKIIQPFYKILYDLVPCFGKPGWISYGIICETSYFESIFEKWILSRCESLAQFNDSELSNYRFHLIIPRVIQFLEDYFKWFIPTQRIAGKTMDANTILHYTIVRKLLLVLAPFAPFFSEFIFQIVKQWSHSCDRDFMQNCLFLEKADTLIDMHVELRMTRWQLVVEMVREARSNHIIPLGYRISELIVVHPQERYLDTSEVSSTTLEKIVNVHHITRTTDRAQFGASLKAKLRAESSLKESLPNEDFEKLASAVQNLDDKEVGDFVRVGSHDVLDQFVSIEDVEVSHVFEHEFDEKSIMVCRDDVFIVVKMNKNLDYYKEGTLREMVNVIQKFRKKAKVYRSEIVSVRYLTEDSCIESAFDELADELIVNTNSKIQPITSACDTNEEEIFQETVDIKSSAVILYLFKEKEVET